MQKVPPPTFLTHNDAIASFTSQCLGLPGRQFNWNKISSQNAPKLAILSSKIYKKIGGIASSSDPSPGGKGTPPHIPLLSFLVLAMIRPPLFKLWIRPWS